VGLRFTYGTCSLSSSPKGLSEKNISATTNNKNIYCQHHLSCFLLSFVIPTIRNGAGKEDQNSMRYDTNGKNCVNLDAFAISQQRNSKYRYSIFRNCRVQRIRVVARIYFEEELNEDTGQVIWSTENLILEFPCSI